MEYEEKKQAFERVLLRAKESGVNLVSIDWDKTCTKEHQHDGGDVTQKCYKNVAYTDGGAHEEFKKNMRGGGKPYYQGILDQDFLVDKGGDLRILIDVAKELGMDVAINSLGNGYVINDILNAYGYGAADVSKINANFPTDRGNIYGLINRSDMGVRPIAVANKTDANNEMRNGGGVLMLDDSHKGLVDMYVTQVVAGNDRFGTPVNFNGFEVARWQYHFHCQGPIGSAEFYAQMNQLSRSLDRIEDRVQEVVQQDPEPVREDIEAMLRELEVDSRMMDPEVQERMERGSPTFAVGDDGSGENYYSVVPVKKLGVDSVDQDLPEPRARTFTVRRDDSAGNYQEVVPIAVERRRDDSVAQDLSDSASGAGLENVRVPGTPPQLTRQNVEEALGHVISASKSKKSFERERRLGAALQIMQIDSDMGGEDILHEMKGRIRDVQGDQGPVGMLISVIQGDGESQAYEAVRFTGRQKDEKANYEAAKAIFQDIKNGSLKSVPIYNDFEQDTDQGKKDRADKALGLLAEIKTEKSGQGRFAKAMKKGSDQKQEKIEWLYDVLSIDCSVSRGSLLEEVAQKVAASSIVTDDLTRQSPDTYSIKAGLLSCMKDRGDFIKELVGGTSLSEAAKKSQFTLDEGSNEAKILRNIRDGSYASKREVERAPSRSFFSRGASRVASNATSRRL